MKYYFVKNEEKTRNTNYKIEVDNQVHEKIIFFIPYSKEFSAGKFSPIFYPIPTGLGHVTLI